MPVEIETENELIAGFNDFHLVTRISVLPQDGQARITISPHANNMFSKRYLETILPSHIFIARNALVQLYAAQC